MMGAPFGAGSQADAPSPAVSAVPVSIPSAAWPPSFKVLDAVRRAISDPGAAIGDRLRSDVAYETLSHWQARAAIRAYLDASAIEARRAETLAGSVHESAVPLAADAQGQAS